MTTLNVGRATVRVVGLNIDNGVAFVRIGHGDETRVRWQRVGTRVRWRCGRHPGEHDCTHTRAVVWHITADAMRTTTQETDTDD